MSKRRLQTRIYLIKKWIVIVEKGIESSNKMLAKHKVAAMREQMFAKTLGLAEDRVAIRLLNQLAADMVASVKRRSKILVAMRKELRKSEKQLRSFTD